ncbi:response regulator [Flocculibacter collagenilyticus]|uniref:response regulator n=1 Tax=Flocculibacter collagenilyticus TaxID=2744479 RepID=UPI0018F3E521|nr:response regulator [Flocculibacter collagenilyticus]
MNQRILLVDDNIKVRSNLLSELTKMDYLVIEASDGLDGLKKANQYDVDCCLIDYKMPIMDGVILCKNLRKLAKYKHTPIYIMTTEKNEQLINQAKKYNVQVVLEKPISSSLLLSVIGEGLNDKIA